MFAVKCPLLSVVIELYENLSFKSLTIRLLMSYIYIYDIMQLMSYIYIYKTLVA